MEDYQFILILNDIRSALNVGAILRTADAVGISKVYLCGITPTPEHPKVAKTSLGAENFVTWEYKKSVTTVISNLRKIGYQITGLEIDPKSINFWQARYSNKIALLVGNEVEGIPRALIKKCTLLIKIPMSGKKESLNVATATGIAVYEIAKQISGIAKILK